MHIATGPAVLAAMLLAAGCAAAGPGPTAGTGPAPAPEGRPPNIVLILADDLGYGDLNVQGATDVRTPQLDALARAGLQLTDAYVSAPQCFPSRAALMTGRYAQRFGVEHNHSASPTDLPLDQKTLAERFRAAGYATGLVGKWNLGEDEAHDPIARGFDEFFGFTHFAHRYVRNDRFKEGEDDPLRRGRTPVLESEYLTDAFARESRDFILRHADRPFFLFASFNAPHNPIQPEPDALAAFGSVPKRTRAEYAALVLSLDDAVGVIRRTLEETGLARNTLVVFYSDNGAESFRGGCNDPLRGAKHTLWEGGIRVPFLVSWPERIPASRLEGRPAMQIDLAATTLSACGIPVEPGAFDGKNRIPRWSGSVDDAGDDPLFFRFMGGERMTATHAWAIRRGPWKAGVPTWRGGRVGEEGAVNLFNLPEDPGEARDLAASEPERAAALRAEWERWNATLPPPGDRAYGEGEGEAGQE